MSLSTSFRKSLLFTFFAAFCLLLQAQPKPGYYSKAEGQSQAALKTALHHIIKNHTDVGYTALYEVYRSSDKREDGKVWDMYSNCDFEHGRSKCGQYKKVCDCYNREHSIPQSWFNKREPMRNDAFHVYPTDGQVNNQRGNDPFGECAQGKSLGGKALGKSGRSTFPGYSGQVFEPVDEYKGDFARTYFYFATRYEDIMNSIHGASFVRNSYPSISEWSIRLFLKWHRQDPVSKKEKDRNNAVEKFQHNRNPFIDHPELAEYIWGDKKGLVWNLTSDLPETRIEFSLKPNPVRDLLYVETTESELSYVIYSMSGQVLQSGRLEGEAISVSALENGMYLIFMQSGLRKSVGKFIISK